MLDLGSATFWENSFENWFGSAQIIEHYSWCLIPFNSSKVMRQLVWFSLPLLIHLNSSAIRLLCWKWMHEQFVPFTLERGSDERADFSIHITGYMVLMNVSIFYPPIIKFMLCLSEWLSVYFKRVAPKNFRVFFLSLPHSPKFIYMPLWWSVCRKFSCRIWLQVQPNG